jgi:hypothetical protein
MKLIQSAMAPLFTLALMVLAGSADATSSKAPRAIEPIEASQVASDGLPQLSPQTKLDIENFKYQVASDSSPRCIRLENECLAGRRASCNIYARTCLGLH